MISRCAELLLPGMISAGSVLVYKKYNVRAAYTVTTYTLSKSCPILLFDGYPGWYDLTVTTDELIHVVLRYTIEIHAIPVPQHHVCDIPCVVILTTAVMVVRRA